MVSEQSAPQLNPQHFLEAEPLFSTLSSDHDSVVMEVGFVTYTLPHYRVEIEFFHMSLLLELSGLQTSKYFKRIKT